MSTTIASASVRISPDLGDFKAELEAEVRSSLANATAKVKVDADTAEAEGQLALFDAELDEISHKSVTATVKVNTNSADTKAAEESLSGILTAVATLGPALIPITAGVIGFGAAAAEAFGAVGLGAGVVALAFGAIKKEVTTDLTPALNQLKQTAASGILPGVKQDISDLIPEIPKVRGLVADLSVEIGHLSAEGGQALGGPAFRGFFTFIDNEAVPIVDEFGHIIGNLAEGFAGLATQFGPVTTQIGAGLESLSARFSAGASSSVGLQHFIAYLTVEGPQVAHDVEQIGAAFGHVVSALAPVGGAILGIVTDLAGIVHAFPKGVIEALAIGFAAYTVETKLAGVATKAFGADAEGATAVAGPLAAALAAVAIGFTAYETAKQQNAEVDAAAAAATNKFVDSLHTVYTSSSSVASSVSSISKEIGVYTQALGGAGSVKSITTIVQTLEDLHQAQLTVARDGPEAQSNAQALAQQYGLTTAEVVKLAGGSKNLIGSLTTVGAHFKTLVGSAEATHNPLHGVALDEQVLGDRAATATAQLSALSDEFTLFAGNALSAQQASLTFKDDVASLVSALKTSHGSLDANSTAGRAAKEAFVAASQGAGTLESAVLKQTGSVKAAKASLEDSIKTLEAVGGNSQAARHEIDLLKAAYDHIPDSSKQAASGVASNSAQISKNAKQAADDAGGSLKAAVPQAKTAGLEFSQGYAAGITSGQVPVINAAVALAAKAVKAVKDTQKSGSPSLVMYQEGINAGDGLAGGLDASQPKVAASAKALAAKITSIDDYLGLGFNTDATGTVKQIDTGFRDLSDRLSAAGKEKGLSSELEMTRKGLIALAEASKQVNTSLKAASSALQTLRSDAANVRSSTLSSFQSLGDPSQFNGINSVAGVLSVLGGNDKIATAFDSNLARLRKDGLSKSAYNQLLAGGPGQNSQIAALLATATKAQIRQFDREENLLSSEGTSTGKSSATYLFGREIAAEKRVVDQLKTDRKTLHDDQRELAKTFEKSIERVLKGANANTGQIVGELKRQARDLAHAMNGVASAEKQTKRAIVAGARR